VSRGFFLLSPPLRGGGGGAATLRLVVNNLAWVFGGFVQLLYNFASPKSGIEALGEKTRLEKEN